MRIVAARARPLIAAGAFARDYLSLLDPPHSPSRRILPCINEIRKIGGDRVSRLVVDSGAIRTLDGNVPFEMAADAYRIAAIGIELRRIDDRCFATGGEV